MGVSRDCPIFSGTPYYLRNNKSYGFQIWPVHSEYIQYIPNKSPLKILEKRERGRIEGLPNFFGYPLLSQERGKLQISNLASTFRGSTRIKAHEKFWKKGAWAYPGTAHFFRVPPIISGTGKAIRISNCACTFIGSIGTKAH